MPQRKQPAELTARPKTTADKVQVYTTTAPLLESMLNQIKELAKKKPDATISKANVSRINRLLRDIRECLKDEEASKYLDLLDDDTLPQYSDALIVMSQYHAALGAFRDCYLIKVDDPTGLDTWRETHKWSIE